MTWLMEAYYGGHGQMCTCAVAIAEIWDGCQYLLGHDTSPWEQDSDAQLDVDVVT